VDRYADYLEFVLGLSLTGISNEKRQVLREYVVKDWKADPAAREVLCKTVKTWTEMAQAPPAKRSEWRAAQQPKVLAQLRLAGDERGTWLASLYDNEQLTYKILSNAQRIKHEATMSIIRNITPTGGRYEYNGATGRYDRYVPNR
jgi:hypothetical protein